MSYELHYLCSLFPRIVGAEFDALVADIRANGLRQPITLHDGKILDGGNRYRACIEAGIDPEFVEFDGDNALSFVLSANMHRRHMSAGQQAAIVATAQNWAQAQTVGRPEKVQDCTISTAEKRAAESGASLRTQKMADKVAKASPELAQKVAHGEVSLPAAVEQVTGKRPGAKAAPAEPTNDDGEPDDAEIAFTMALEAADRALLDKLIESDDKLAAAVAECKRLNAVVVGLEARIRGLQNESNEAKRLAKFWQKKAKVAA